MRTTATSAPWPGAEVTVGMGQMLVRGGRPAENLARAVDVIQRAAGEGCDLVVLPECLDVGWTHPAARELAQPIPGERSALLGHAARQSGVYVAAGLTEREGEQVYNAAVLLSPQGDILLKHRKINELAIAHDLYSIGDRLGVAHTPIGTMALSICADNFPSSLALGHALARMGARLLLSPSAWAVQADYDHQAKPYGALWLEAYTELARLYDLTVVGVSNVGPIEAGVWAGRQCIGCSLAVGPGGTVLAQGPYGDTAEALVVFRAQVRPPLAWGTDLAAVLRDRGYVGP
ncbi:MAG: carbon-nitrogen hydrolase family protein [Anaerolineae bacterium]|nr:carbon-nitrogen hydrolase family protein [Anaerolineae bacterium]